MQPTDPNQFTEKAWEAIVNSQEVARRMRQQNLEVEHVILALLEINDTAAVVLERAQLDPAQVARQLENFGQRQPRGGAGDQLYLGRGLDALLDRADVARESWGDREIGIDHLLLAFADDDRVGRKILRSLRVDPQDVEAAIREIRSAIKAHDTELLALLLRSGTRGHDVLSVSTRLLAEAGSLSGLLGWQAGDFRRVKGIGPVKALQLLTALEIARRLLGRNVTESPLLAAPEVIANYLQPVAAGLDVEKFWVLCLNRRNRLIKRVEISSGTAHSTLAHPREVFRAAVRTGASAVVCAHNHPSGDPSPSSADLQITRLLREAARAVDIPLLDHVVVGRPTADPTGRGYYSFREAGLL